MKENRTVGMDLKRGGYELMGKAMSVDMMRTYWKGNPWKALRNCLRGE